MALADKAAYVVSCWPADSVFTDSVGGLTLTDNGSVAFASGKFGNAFDLTAASSQFCSRGSNDNSLDCADQVYGVRFWVQLKDKSTGYELINMNNQDGGDGGRAWRIYYDNSADRFGAFVNFASAGADNIVCNNLGSPAEDTWYYIYFRHDPTNNRCYMSVNAGTEDQNAGSASNGGLQGTSTARLTIGAVFWSGEVYAGHANAYIDEPLIMVGDVLDATERTEDYNSGTGVAFADWTGAAATVRPRSLLLLGVGC